MLRSRSRVVVAAVYTIVLLATLPLAPKLWWGYLDQRIGDYVTDIFLAIGLATLVWAAWVMRNLPKERRWLRLILLVAAGVGFVWLLFSFYPDAKPAKRFHLLEYGALAILVLRAFDLRNWPGRIAPVIWMLAIAFGDEGIQHLLPERYFGWHDIWGNCFGVALGSVAYLAAVPSAVWQKVEDAIESTDIE